MKKFSFNSVKQAIFPVELPSGDTVTLLAPKKKDAELFASLMGTNDIGAIYTGIASFLSNNREGQEVTVSDIEDLTVPAAMEFLVAYSKFMEDIQPKN